MAKKKLESRISRLEARSNQTFMDREFGRSSPEPGYEAGLVFLIMPIGSAELEKIFSIYSSECARLGLRAVRADSVPDSGFILKYIIEMIEKAEFIICDLSNERPNVYYELGYAHGVGNQSDRVFLTAAAQTHLHFDIAPFRVHFYEDANGLRQLMRTEFKKLVRNIRAETQAIGTEPGTE